MKEALKVRTENDIAADSGRRGQPCRAMRAGGAQTGGSYASPPGQMLSLSQGGSSPRGIRRRGGFENRPFFNCQISLGGLLRFFFSTTGRFSKTLAWRNGWFSKPSRLRVPYKVPRCSAAVIGNLSYCIRYGQVSAQQHPILTA